MWLNCWEPQRTAISVVSESFEITCPDLGMSLRRKGSSIRVSQLTDGPALRSGKINRNDRLLEIDGHVVKKFCASDLRKILVERDFVVINLVFSRSSFFFGEDFTYKVSLSREGRQGERYETKYSSPESSSATRQEASEVGDAAFSPRASAPAPYPNLKKGILISSVRADPGEIGLSLSIKDIKALDYSVAPSTRATAGDSGITIFLPDSIETRTKDHLGQLVDDGESCHQVTSTQNNRVPAASAPMSEQVENFAQIFATKTGKRPLSGKIRILSPWRSVLEMTEARRLPRFGTRNKSREGICSSKLLYIPGFDAYTFLCIASRTSCQNDGRNATFNRF
jgi:hypothetical protein